MARYSQLVLLIFTVQCRAIEYYVKPTADTGNISCPTSQPCFTINQYTDPSNNFLEQNNTVFTFLPGKHLMERPLEFINVKNITLQAKEGDNGDYPQLILTYKCSNTIGLLIPYKYMYIQKYIDLLLPCCCSTIYMNEVFNVTISGLTIKAKENISGIIIENSIDIKIQQNVISYDDDLVNTATPFGILIGGSIYITIGSLQTKNAMFGVLMEGVDYVTVQNSSFQDSSYSGLYMIGARVVKLLNLAIDRSGGYGLVLSYTIYSSVENIHMTSSGFSGLLFDNCVYTEMINISSMKNQDFGVDVWSCTDTIMKNISTMNNMNDGIDVWYSNNTTIMNISSMNNGADGIDIWLSEHTTMMNISSISNQIYGVFVSNSTHTTVMNALSINNQNDGVSVWNSKVTTMMHISSMNNQHDGISVEVSPYTTMINISSLNNHKNCILILHSNNTTMIDIISSMNGQYAGIYVEYSTNTTMINISAMNSQEFSSVALSNSVIFLLLCSNVHIFNISILVDENVHQNNQNTISFFNCTNVILEESIFSGIMSDLQQVNTNVANLPAIITLYDTTLILKNCNFTYNAITSIAATSSIITVEENILFESISAISGAAFIFSRSSVLIISEQSNIVFYNNSASQYGGVFYIVTEEVPNTSKFIAGLIYQGTRSFITSGTHCFIQVAGTRSNTAHLTFINNTAVEGGDVVYGGQVAAGYDGDWNCLLSFKNISDMTDQSSVKQITSAPSRVCPCHNTSPDCLIVVDPTIHTLYPGEILPVSVAVVGQDFGTVSGYVNAQFMDTDVVVSDDQKRVIYHNDVCKKLEYTVYSSCEDCDAVLVLTSDGRMVSQPMNIAENQKLNQSWSILQSEPDYHELAFRYAQELIAVLGLQLYISEEYDEVVNSVINNFFTLTPEDIETYIDNFTIQNITFHNKLRFPQQIYTYPLYINIQFKPCPLGFTLSQSQCDCNQLLQYMPTVECNIDGQTITRAGSVWVGVDGNETVAASQYCPLNYCRNDSVQLTLKDNNSTSPDSQCNYRHSGILCGGCQPGLSLALGSEQCLHCSNAYISLVLPFVLAGVLLVLFIKVLDFTVCHGAINGLIFYANVINANKHIYYNQSDINPITLFISWFNLDLGIETCFYDGLTAYVRTWLQFIFPIYIWCIAGAIIILANHSKRVAAVAGNNGVPVLATLFLLSYAKLFNTIISVISYTTLYTTQGERLVWTVDGNIDYLGPKHAPLFAVAVIVLLFLWLPYTLILLFGKHLHKINCRLLARYLLKLKPFLDANYAPFNDCHQYWFGVILVVKAAILLSSATIPANGAHIVVFSVVIASWLLTFWGNVVFTNTKTMLFHTFFFVNLGILNVTKMFIYENMVEMTIASYILIGLVLVQFLGICVVNVVKLSTAKWSYLNIICCRRNETEDDWELYMVAALQRQKEPESDEDKDAHSSGSIESLPTYPLV